MSKHPDPSRASWMDVTNESVHTSDDVDIGDIEAISRDFIVVKRGFIHIHRYYIPISKVEGWDGHVVWLRITEDDVKRDYERNKAPNPINYYIMGYPYGKTPKYTRAYFPKMEMIPPKSKETDYASSRDSDGTSKGSKYSCALCDTAFATEDDLSKHASEQH